MNFIDNLLGRDVNSAQNTTKEEEVNNTELIQKFEELFEESKPLYEKRKKYTDINKKYYIGELFPRNKFFLRPTWKSNTVVNKIFENIETIVPIMTEDIPAPMGAVNSNDPAVLDVVRNVEAALKYIQRNDNFSIKVEQIVRDMLIYRDAVVSPMYDLSKGLYGDITIEILDPKYFYIDPSATVESQGNYFFKCVPRTLRWISTHFPDKQKEIEDYAGLSEYQEEEKNDNLYYVKEIWYWRQEDNGQWNIWCASYIGDVLLYHERNPFWDFDGIEDPELDNAKKKVIQEFQQNIIVNEGREATEEELQEIEAEFQAKKKYRNFFEEQKLPYIIIPSFPDYTAPFSTTSLIEQVAPLQDSLNKRKQQIEENANLTANVQWAIDKDSGVDVRQLSSKPNLVIEKNRGTTVEKLQSPSLPGYLFDDKQDTGIALDNIFGANSISKGQRVNTQTATEATILKDADEGRIALMMRHLYTGLEEIYKWQIHLMKLFYVEERQVVLFNSVGGFESFQTITSDDIPDGMQIFINSAAAQPRDQFTRRREAEGLYNQKAIDPITYYELRGDIPNPEETARRLDAWMKGSLFQEEKPPSIEEMAHQENEMIQSGQAKTIENVPPNPEATEAHLLIHQELFKDPKSGLTDKQLALLEEHIGLESEILDAKLNEKMNAIAMVQQPMMPEAEQMPVMPEDGAMEEEMPMSDSEIVAMLEAEKNGGQLPQDMVM